MDFIIIVGIVVILAVVAIFMFKPSAPASSVPRTTTPQFKVIDSKKPTTAVETAKKADVDDGKQRVKIYFGSQTGTAQEFAKTLQQEAKRNNFAAHVVDLEETSFDDLAKEKFAIFVLATYGDGEPTDNAKEFYEKLMDASNEPDFLKDLKYTVFGLGNRTYQHFNAVARAVDQRLAELGAQRVFERGEGDDDGRLEEDFTKWKSLMWEPVCATFGNKVGDEKQAILPTCDLVYLDESEVATVKPSSGLSGYDMKNPVSLTVVENRELHGPESDRSCRHVEFDISSLSYEPGDHLGIFPLNSDEVVLELISILQLSENDLDRQICLKSKDSSVQSPVLGPCTLRQALKSSCDLLSIPRKNVFSALAQYATDEKERTQMSLLGDSSPEGVAKYAEWVSDAGRTISEVLRSFPSCRPPLGHLLELLPRLQPRFYSISSSLQACPNRVSVTAVLVTFTTTSGRIHKGVATHFLASLVPQNSTARGFIRKSTFHLPRSISTPILMIGPGTGLAPFRGFIQERSLQRKAALNSSSTELGKNILYFGCRTRHQDYLYQEELETYQKEEVIDLHVSFSREGDSKDYVQHRIWSHKEHVFEFLKGNGMIYICGDAKHMAKDVMKTFLEVIKEIGQMDEEAANGFFTKIQQNGRLLQDVW